MSELTFRPASTDDAESVLALVRSAYRGEGSRAGWTTEADLLADERISLDGVRDKITDPAARVLLAEGVEGLVACCEVVDRGEGTAYFGMFAVQPALQAAGLGRQVLAEAERWAREQWGATTMEMTVIRQRVELIAWYERRGYLRTGEIRPFPYAELVGGPALRDDLAFAVLRKPLTGPQAEATTGYLDVKRF